MSAGQLGQVTTLLLALVLVAMWVYHYGFFRGWRRGFREGQDTTAETLRSLPRIGLPSIADDTADEHAIERYVGS